MSIICHNVPWLLSELPRFEFGFDETLIPANGICIVFEKGERAHETDRIVRIGTHAGDNRLPSTAVHAANAVRLLHGSVSIRQKKNTIRPFDTRDHG